MNLVLMNKNVSHRHSPMISIVVADDEPLARYKLGHLIRCEDDVQLVGEASSSADLLEVARLTRPDVIFVDFQMAGMDGFEALKTLSAKEGPLPRIVITAAHDRYAVRAFELNAVDYLLKPYAKERFQAALDRARLALRPSSPTLQNSRYDEKRDRLIFKSGGRILFIPMREIWFISAEENYVRLTTSSESHLLRDTISNFEMRLDPERFLRIHRSTIVNLRHVREMRSDGPRGELEAIMADGHRLSVSRGFRSRVTQLVSA